MKWLAGLVVAQALRFRADEDKNRPVSKVITLLKDMQKTLEKEAEDDQEIYDKMTCWCKENDREKTQALKDAESEIKRLTASIERNTAKAAELGAEIVQHDKELAEQQQSLEAATKIRTKEAQEFNDTHKEVLQTIAALKSALVVLEKHQGGKSLLQADITQDSMILDVKTTLQHTMRKFGSKLNLDDDAKQTVQNFLQGKLPVNEYSNQSGQIFGILSNMLDTFIADNKEDMDAEASKAAAYQELKASKLEMISLTQEQLDRKTDAKAQAVGQVGDDKENKKDTEENLSEDEKFLLMLKEKCAMSDAEWANRSKTRTEEQAAVAGALNVLAGDDAHDTFTRTFNPSFLQKNSNNKRVRASKLVQKVADKFDSPKLALVAQKMKRESFDKVIQAIDKMIKDLGAQKQEEIQHRDSCVANFHKNEMTTQEKNQEKSDADAQMERLAAKIDSLKKQIANEQQAIKDAQKMLKEEGENRAKANAEFQTMVKDQRETVMMLNKAVQFLKSFYEKNAMKAPELIQEEPEKNSRPPPPGGFKDYKKSSGGNSVIAMITQIIADAKAAEAEAVHDEQSSQETYEQVVQDTNEMINKKNISIVNLSNTSATAKTDHLSEKQRSADLKIELKALSEEDAALHESCDFYMNNFDVRQQAFGEEIDALQQAKSILKGSDFGK